MSATQGAADTELDGKSRQLRTMRAMQRRMADHLKAGRTTDLAPSTLEFDASIYTDPVRLATEKRELFLKLPLVAGLSCDIPNPGDVMLFDAAGPSILIVRGKDKKVRAFLNACRHRAGPVVRTCSNRQMLSCPFHGWTYDLTGKLVGIPGEDGFAGIDRNSRNLISVPVAEWHGFIFVKAHAGDETIDVDSFLGSLAPEMRQLDVSKSRPVTSRRVDVASNWKFAQDTFFEGYHFATIHPKTINTVNFSNVTIHDNFGPHQRVMMPTRTYMDWIAKPEADWPQLPYQGIHLIFPNTIFFVGHLETFNLPANSMRQIYGMWRIFPGKEPGSSFTLMSTFQPLEGNVDAELDEYKEVSEFIINVVRDEDYSLCAEGQRNLESSEGAKKILLGRNEVALQSIERHIAKAIGLPLT